MDNIEIIRWTPAYSKDFIRLNREWIEHYFNLEPSDLKLLGNPKAEIIDKGGEIFLARKDGRIVGCCALIYHADSQRYELAKMAVSPNEQGHGIGYRLGKALIDHARQKGVKLLFLEANTKLAPSIALYYKLGFKAVEANHPAYARCNLYMEKEL